MNIFRGPATRHLSACAFNYLHFTAEGGAAPFCWFSSVTSTSLLCFVSVAVRSCLPFVSPLHGRLCRCFVFFWWVCKSLARSLNSSIKYSHAMPFCSSCPGFCTLPSIGFQGSSFGLWVGSSKALASSALLPLRTKTTTTTNNQPLETQRQRQSNASELRHRARRAI